MTQDTRTYKVYQAKYLIPKSDKGPAFTLPADPIKYHAELFRNGKLSAFITRNTVRILSALPDYSGKKNTKTCKTTQFTMVKLNRKPN